MPRLIFVHKKTAAVAGGAADDYWDGTDLYVDEGTNQYIDSIPNDYEDDGNDLYVDESANQYIDSPDD